MDDINQEKTPAANERMGVHKRTTLMLLLFGIVVSSVITLVALSSFKEQLKNDFHAHLLSVAEIQKLRVETFVERSKERMVLVSSSTQLRISLQSLQQKHSQAHQDKMIQIVHDAQNSIPDFYEISVVNIEGRVVASTLPDLIGKTRFHRELSHWGAEKDSEGKLSIHLHEPLLLDQRVVGSLHIMSHAAELSEISSSYAGLGESGESLLAEQLENGDARFLTPLRFDAEAALKRTISADRIDIPIIRALGRQAGFHEDIVDYREIPVVAVTTYLSNPHWGLLIKMDQAEVYKPYLTLRNQLAMLLVLIAFAGVLFAYYIAKHWSRPLHYLTAVADSIRRGDHTARADLKSELFDQETYQLARSLNEMTDELLQVFESSLSGMLIVDRDGQIIQSNRALDQIFGYEPGELIGQLVETLVPNSYRDQHVTHRGHFTEKGNAKMGSQRGLDLFGLSKTGKKIPIEVGLSMLIHDEERRTLATVVDVTDRVQRIQEVEMQKEKDRFFAHMSHEIRTPMNGVIGLSYLALRCDTTPEVSEYLEKIKQSGEFLLSIINDILDFSKIEAGELRIEKIDFELREILEKLSNILAFQASDKGLIFKVNAASSIPKYLKGTSKNSNFSVSARKHRTESRSVHAST
jgi:PAS domain S-box-containing protein